MCCRCRTTEDEENKTKQNNFVVFVLNFQTDYFFLFYFFLLWFDAIEARIKII